MKKEDGANLAAEEQAQFKVIEFNKEGKKLIVSHTGIWGEVAEAANKAKSTASRKAVQNLNSNQEKSTLGDLDVLADLKKKMEGGKKSYNFYFKIVKTRPDNYWDGFFV